MDELREYMRVWLTVAKRRIEFGMGLFTPSTLQRNRASRHYLLAHGHT